MTESVSLVPLHLAVAKGKMLQGAILLALGLALLALDGPIVVGIIGCGAGGSLLV